VNIYVRVDGLDAFRKTLDDVAARQLPFAASRAINALGLEFQRRQRATLQDTFTLRRPDFIAREGVKRLGPAARKERLFVTFGTSDRASFLDKFETGESKRPREGHSLALPVSVRRNKRDIVPRTQRPRQLLDKGSQKQGAGSVFRVPQGTSARLMPGLYQRAGRGGRESLRFLWAFKPTTPVPASLHFERTARAVMAEWPDHFAREFAAALRSAK
jgi:hypothetical protein